ncbi:glycine zipper 2TM protein [Paucimonas lemoignei]|uniref:Glycine zipper 2TM protein n=1 Tax=Paucimonas lemoignei TaxID=29443 RepID=A0A4R3HQR3_PAULE|nr:glycine zipper 2TM domain-containing protein [Paucimonas lemoignei]TCS34683.1 glycine zipper 2TM protein [Paucimonas lemoignei]
MIKRKLSALASSVMLVFLVACSTNSSTYPRTSTYPGTTNYPAASQSATLASGYGVVQAIDMVPRENAGSGIGIGTVAGAVVGGVLGNQVGSGTGRTAATVAGVAGGALAGHAIENRTQGQAAQVYRVTLRMDDGTIQTLVQESTPSLRIGDRVRISNGVIERM